MGEGGTEDLSPLLRKGCVKNIDSSTTLNTLLNVRPLILYVEASCTNLYVEMCS